MSYGDLTGQQFGRWTVKARGENKGTQRRWQCVCADAQDQQQRQQRLQANQKRVDQLQGGIDALKEIQGLVEDVPTA